MPNAPNMIRRSSVTSTTSSSIKDPIATVEGIYRHFGIELTDDGPRGDGGEHAESKKGPRAPKHTYSLRITG